MLIALIEYIVQDIYRGMIKVLETIDSKKSIINYINNQ